MEHVTERPPKFDEQDTAATLAIPSPVHALDDAHFKIIASSAPVMIWACDAHGGYSFFNDQWVLFTGLPRETLLNNPWLMDIKAEDYPAYRRQFLSAFQERKEFRVEYRLRRHDGRYRWLIDTGVPMFDAAGDFIGYIGNCVDITDRHVMEEALAQSERKFKLLFDRSSDAQVLLDGERVIDCNAATATLFRAPDRWSVIGRAAGDFLGHADDASVVEKIRLALVEGSHRFEWMARGLDNTELPVGVLLTAIPMNGRTLVHAAIRDLTAQRELEGRLRQTHKMEAIGTLAGGIAHDFNNLLASIMGFTELALLDLPANAASASRANLMEALTAARRARELVQQINTFSRHDTARRVELDVGTIAEESARLLRASIPATVDLRVTVEKDCVVRGNRVQLQQVLLNLGANAEHAMRGAEGVLEVRVTRDTLDEAAAQSFPGVTPGPVVKVVVRDTGVGMPPNVCERAFDPFYTTKPVGEGTGMGLAVVHGIVTAHGGAIVVDSVVGQGTTFTILMPYAPTAPARRITSAHPASAVATPKHGHVLVVEDEASLGRMLSRLLGRLGYTTDVFDRAREALEAFCAKPAAYHAIVTDLTMPGMTGDTLAAEVRKVRQDIPIVLVTGHSQLVTEERIRDAGVSAVLRKPLTIQELASALDAALGVERAPD
jgi:two-component system cell cycle sensor histidine kinase/response regulator CckA